MAKSTKKSAQKSAKKPSSPKRPQIDTLNDALILKIKSLYDIENILIKALPKMAKNSTDPDLAAAFESHLEETKGHAARLEQVFELLDSKVGTVKVEAIRGLVDDAEWIIKQKPSQEALDAQLIAAASYVEQYEAAGYASAARWASLLGYTDVLALLDQTLSEEEAVADKLVNLAEAGIDERALGQDAIAPIGGDDTESAD